MTSLLDTVRGALGPEVIERAGGLIGENTTVTRRALDSAVPSVLAGVLGQASTPSGAERLLSTITEDRLGADTLSGLGRQLGARGTAETLLSSGGRLLSGLFGRQADSVTEAVAGAGGVGRGAASTLLRLAAPIVLSVIGSRVAAGGLNAGGLSRLLAGERSSILGAAPAGVVNMLGLGEPATTPTYERSARTTTQVEPVEPEPVEPARRETSSSWWPYALAGLAGLALVYFLSRAPETETARIEPPPRPAPARPAVPTTPEPSAAPSASVREPAAAAPPGAIGEISAFLVGSGPTPRSFTLDELTFESGSARLAASSQPTVAALAGLLQKHSSARVRLEGHTDTSGSAAANKQLSQQRAAVVKQSLVAAGVDADRIEAIGQGADKPVADNASDAGRAQNRRTELIVVER